VGSDYGVRKCERWEKAWRKEEKIEEEEGGEEEFFGRTSMGMRDENVQSS
jgi:hypothetical protein